MNQSAIPNPHSAIEKRWTLAATILGSAMAFIDGSVVNVALPSIQRDLSASVADMQWVINAYTLFLGALILVGGSAGDLYGRRRIFTLGILLFTVASVWCGLAPNVMQLIAARGLQGIGGAMMVPSSLAIISATFEKEVRGRAIGTWAGFSALTTALGPVLGGWLVDTFSWRPIFFVNLPLALVTLAITFRHVHESREGKKHEGLDWTGALLATLGLGSITYTLIEGEALGWGSPIIIGTSLGAMVAFGCFFLVEARSHAPMMPIDIFRSRTFSGANLLTFFLYFTLGGALFFLPFNLIQVQGYSATEAGSALLPFPLIMGGLSRWSGSLIDRYGAKKPLMVGPIIVAIAYVLFAFTGFGGSYWTTFFPAVIVLGIGMTISVAPLTTAVMGAVDEHKAGVASGINNAVSRIAGMLAVAVFGIVALGAFSASLDRELQKLDLSPQVRTVMRSQETKLAAATPPSDVSRETRSKLEQAVRESFVYGFRLVMLIAAALAMVSALCATVMIEQKESVVNSQ